MASDGSPKSREALFVAAYLAEQWKTSLTVVTVVGRGRVKPSVLDLARAYLELHELQADYLIERGTVEVLHAIMHERRINLLLMGGYSASLPEELLVSSAVNRMLRERHSPIFICR